jgi:hypothetical protein
MRKNFRIVFGVVIDHGKQKTASHPLREINATITVRTRVAGLTHPKPSRRSCTNVTDQNFYLTVGMSQSQTCLRHITSNILPVFIVVALLGAHIRVHRLDQHQLPIGRIRSSVNSPDYRRHARILNCWNRFFRPLDPFFTGKRRFRMILALVHGGIRCRIVPRIAGLFALLWSLDSARLGIGSEVRRQFERIFGVDAGEMDSVVSLTFSDEKSFSMNCHTSKQRQN